MVCASEQAVILDDAIYDAALAEFAVLHAYRANARGEGAARAVHLRRQGRGHELRRREAQRVRRRARRPQWIAEQAGFTVPDDTSIILVEVAGVGPQEPLTREKLAPVLAVLRADSHRARHPAGRADGRVRRPGSLRRDPHAGRRPHRASSAAGSRPSAIIANAPSSLGGIGDIYNAFIPSLTLGCGSYGHNSVSNNVSAVNLVNIKRDRPPQQQPAVVQGAGQDLLRAERDPLPRATCPTSSASPSSPTRP